MGVNRLRLLRYWSQTELSHDFDDSGINYIQEVEIDPDQQGTENISYCNENNKLA